MLDFSTLLFRAPALLIALTIHEYAHACVSDSLGDPTPGLQGRLTLNPLAHLDIIGTLMLVLCGFGWAKPVEIDPRYYKDYRSGQLKVSAAGPLANLFLCFVAVLIMTARGSLGMSSNMVNQFLYWLMLYNGDDFLHGHEVCPEAGLDCVVDESCCDIGFSCSARPHEYEVV